MKKINIALFLLMVAFSFAHGQRPLKPDSLYNALDKIHTFNGNVLIAENGKIIYQRSFGYSSLKPNLVNTSSSAFQIGSVSKTFTAVAVMQLAEKGIVNINDPVIMYLPSFPYPAVTIYQLLTHTSGPPDKEELFFPLIEKHPDTAFSNQDIIPAMQALGKSLAFTPGSNWRYCNIGYAVLAMVVEKASGQTFGGYLQQHIFKLAGMEETYLLGHTKTANEATGYLVRTHYLGDLETIDTSRKVRSWAVNMRNLEGPTNIVSTTGDLLKYDIALRCNKLLKTATMKKMFMPGRLTDSTVAAAGGEFGDAGYGLGWFIQADTSAGNIVMHTGGEPGFFSFFLRDLSHNRTIILLDNAESTGFGLACRESFNIISGVHYFLQPHYKQSFFLPYARALYSQGVDEAATLFNRLKTDTANYFTDERELNELGLELLNDGHIGAALQALKLCTFLYPGGWNPYDSYGKALLQAGKKELAISMYEKSLLMNQQNEPARQILRKIRP